MTDVDTHSTNEASQLKTCHQTSSGVLYSVALIFLGMVSHILPIKKGKKDSVRKANQGFCCCKRSLVKLYIKESDSMVKQNLHKVKTLSAEQAWPSCLFVPPSPPCLVCICTGNAPILHLSMPQSRGLGSPVTDSYSSLPPGSSSMSVLLVFWRRGTLSSKQHWSWNKGSKVWSGVTAMLRRGNIQ